MPKTRARKENNLKARVWNKTEGHCHLCGERLSYHPSKSYFSKWDKDHVVPKVHGGPDDEWNLLPACRFCNRMKKSARKGTMRQLLMYGRYCLDKAAERKDDDDGKLIFRLVGGRVREVKLRAKTKPPHVQLWRRTPKKK